MFLCPYVHTPTYLFTAFHLCLFFIYLFMFSFIPACVPSFTHSIHSLFSVLPPLFLSLTPTFHTQCLPHLSRSVLLFLLTHTRYSILSLLCSYSHTSHSWLTTFSLSLVLLSHMHTCYLILFLFGSYSPVSHSFINLFSFYISLLTHSRCLPVLPLLLLSGGEGAGGGRGRGAAADEAGV